MKYIKLVNGNTKNAMRLQSIGLVQGTPAKEIKQGDYLMWNFGHTTKVNRIVSQTPKTLVIEETDTQSGKIYERKMTKDRLVCILQP